jgi:F-type H+-transporting ATPase subunit gamma
MRLISMSARSHLKSKELPLREYMQTISSLLAQIQQHAPHWQNPLLNPLHDGPHNPLVIIIGSQRGLCGNFNTTLFHFFQKTIAKAPHAGGVIPVIPIGKKAVIYCENNPLFKIIKSYPELHAKKIEAISQELTQLLESQQPAFTHVTIFSNTLKTFFVQKPQETPLIPLSLKTEEKSPNTNPIDYEWEQSPTSLLDQLARQTILINLHYLLFESLLAEHAARFISMDNATRNAQTLLEETTLHYNKLRQAKITKELTELVSSM